MTEALGDPAILISRYGAEMLIQLPDQSIVKAKSRRKNQDLVCGDHLEWQKTSHEDYVVEKRLERTNVLTREYFRGTARHIAANITQLFIITAEKPACDWDIVDHMLCTVELDLKIPAVLIHNKADLPRSELSKARYEEYKDIGYEIIQTSKYDGDSLSQVLAQLDRNVTAIVGQSGMGKSTLVNRLLPNLELQTRELSEKTGFGQHTTSNARFYEMPTDGAIIDTPGIRDFTPLERGSEQWQNGFREFAEHLGNCKYHNCMHIAEPQCAIKAAVSDGRISQRRYETYLRLATGALSPG